MLGDMLLHWSRCWLHSLPSAISGFWWADNQKSASKGAPQLPVVINAPEGKLWWHLGPKSQSCRVPGPWLTLALQVLTSTLWTNMAGSHPSCIKLLAYSGSVGPQVNSMHYTDENRLKAWVKKLAESDLTLGLMPSFPLLRYANFLSEGL